MLLFASIATIATGSRTPIARHKRIWGAVLGQSRQSSPAHLGVRRAIPILVCVKRARAAQLSFAFCSICPPLWSAPSAGQLIACLSVQFAPAMVCGLSGPAYRCLSAQFAPLRRAARAGQLIIALLPHTAHGLSGPAYLCLAAPHSAQPERASLSFERPERASLSYTLCA